MTIVNETGQEVMYWINCAAVGPNCGDIPVNGVVKLPQYDNQKNVSIGFTPAGNAPAFTINVPGDKYHGEQFEMLLVAE